MSFKEVQTLDADNTISLGGRNKKTGKTNPTSTEGYYLGSRQVSSPKSKTGKAAIHFFQTPKGNLGVWGKTDLDRKLSSVTPGTMVRASFDKMVATPNGEMYKFKVEADDSNTIEVSAANADAGYNYGDDSTETTNTEEHDTTNSSDDYELEERSQVAALSVLERKSAVDLLKSKNRNSRN